MIANMYEGFLRNRKHIVGIYNSLRSSMAFELGLSSNTPFWIKNMAFLIQSMYVNVYGLKKPLRIYYQTRPIKRLARRTEVSWNIIITHSSAVFVRLYPSKLQHLIEFCFFTKTVVTKMIMIFSIYKTLMHQFLLLHMKFSA